MAEETGTAAASKKTETHNLAFEDIVIIIALVGVVFALTIGMYIASQLPVDNAFTSKLPGKLIKSAHVHLLGLSTILILMAYLFKRRVIENLEQIKKMGFYLLVFGMVFMPLGLISKGYNMTSLANITAMSEYSFIGGMIILICVFAVSRSPD